MPASLWLQLIKRANKWADYLTLAGSVHFIVSNMTISLESLLTGYPGVVNTIAVQFPDPHFKARHRKRHIVQESFVRACENVLQPGGMDLSQYIGVYFLGVCLMTEVCFLRDSILPVGCAGLFRLHEGDVPHPCKK